LLKLDIDIGETSVSKYLVRRHNPPSQTWRTFLDNHMKSVVSVDFFTVPNIRFQDLYGLAGTEARFFDFRLSNAMLVDGDCK
jgi:hypothetical protein